MKETEKIQYWCKYFKKDLISYLTCLSCPLKIAQEYKDYISCPNIVRRDNPSINVVLPKKIKSYIKGNILIRKLDGGLGDIAMLTIIPQLIKKKYPGKKVYFETIKPYDELLYHNPYTDKLIIKDKKETAYEDLTFIDMDNIPCIYIYQNLDLSVLQLYAKAAGLEYEGERPSFFFTKKEKQEIKEFFKPYKNKIKIGFALKSRIPYKDWPLRYFEELALLLKKDFNAVIFGLHNQPLELENITGIFNLSLRKLLLFISQLDLVIGPDTGILHCAIGLNRKVIGLFFQTSYHRWFAYKYKKMKLLRAVCPEIEDENSDCLGPWKWVCSGICRELLKPQQVFEEIKKWLK